MPTKLDPASDRVEACYQVALQLREKYGSVNRAALETGLNQQTLNSLVSKRKLGIEFADQIAGLLDTTIDGLVWLVLKGGKGAVRAGNVPGWAKAVEDAREEFGELPYALASEVLLPIAPKRASKHMVRDLARFLQDYSGHSHMRLAVSKAGS